MPSILELNEQRQQAIATLEELRDVEDWNEDLEERWTEANQTYDRVSEEWRTAVQSDERRKERNQRLQDIRNDMGKRAETRRYSDEAHPEVMRNRAERIGRTKSLAMAGWILNGSGGTVRSEMRSAAQEVGFDLSQKTFELRFNPYMGTGGQGGWSTCNGAAYVRTEIDRRLKQIEEEERRGVHTFETRDLGTGPAPDGGATVPEGFQRELDIALQQFGGIRRVCRIWSTAGYNPIPWPTMTDVANVGAILAENTSIGSSVDPTFGQVIFNTFKFSSTPVLMAQELIEDSAFQLGALMGRILGERIGRGLSPYLITGTGSGQPGGLLTEATDGPTAPAIAVDFDSIIDLIHSVDPAYRDFPSVGFVFNDTTLGALRKLKDLEGRYYWNPGTIAAEPDRIFGYPYQVDQSMPNIAANAKPIAFGAMEKFVVRDHAAYRFYQLNERWRDLDQTGFIAFSRHDSHLIDAGTNPIKTLVMPAS